MANEILRHHKLTFDTATAFSAEVDCGLLADEGTDLPDPEIQTEGVGGGQQATVGSTMAGVFRILGDGSTWLATLQGYVLDLTEVYFRVYNKAGDEYTQVGPCTITSAYAKGRTSDPRRQSVVVGWSTAGDVPEDFLSNGTTA